MNDLVSIIMPSYNTGCYIKNAIESVLSQTYSDWELLIVDDCSSDNTDEVVKVYLTDQRIKYIKNEKNSGAAVSRNCALREAKGRWIAFLDSDDIYAPNLFWRWILHWKSARVELEAFQSDLGGNGHLRRLRDRGDLLGH